MIGECDNEGSASTGPGQLLQSALQYQLYTCLFGIPDYVHVLGIYMITAWTLIDNYTLISIMGHFWIQCMKLLP